MIHKILRKPDPDMNQLAFRMAMAEVVSGLLLVGTVLLILR